MADLKEKWKRLKGQMKAERMAKPTNNGKKESNCGQKEDNKRKELVVQQLSSHVAELEALSSDGFRKAFKGKSITPGFCNTIWVVKRYLPEALNTNKKVGQTVEEHTKKAIQTHLLAKNFAQVLDKEVLQRDIADFGKTLMYNKIFLSKFQACGESRLGIIALHLSRNSCSRKSSSAFNQD
eukprot:gene21040-23095_t